MLKKIESTQLPDKNAVTTSIAISPNGQFIATIIQDFQVIIYHFDPANKDGKLLQTHKIIPTDHTKGINQLVWSPDSQCVATCSDDCSIELYHIQLGKLQTLMGHTAPVITIRYSLKGNLLFSGSMDESIKIWNIGVSGIVSHTTNGTNHGQFLLTAPMKTMSAHSDPVVTLDIPNFDSSIIASGSYDGLIRIFDTKTGNCLKTLTYDKDWANDGVLPITNVKFSYNGKYLLVKSMDGVLKLWDYITGKVVRTFTPSDSDDNDDDDDDDNDRMVVDEPCETTDGELIKTEESAVDEDDVSDMPLDGKHCTGMSFIYPNDHSPYIIDGSETGDILLFDVLTKKIVQKEKISSSCIIDIQVYNQFVCALTLNGQLDIFEWYEETVM